MLCNVPWKFEIILPNVTKEATRLNHLYTIYTTYIFFVLNIELSETDL